MDLYEHQGKRYLARFGVPVGRGSVADTVDAAVAAADRIGYPVVLKAQVKTGGRGKAGGVRSRPTAPGPPRALRRSSGS